MNLHCADLLMKLQATIGGLEKQLKASSSEPKAQSSAIKAASDSKTKVVSKVKCVDMDEQVRAYA